MGARRGDPRCQSLAQLRPWRGHRRVRDEPVSRGEAC